MSTEKVANDLLRERGNLYSSREQTPAAAKLLGGDLRPLFLPYNGMCNCPPEDANACMRLGARDDAGLDAIGRGWGGVGRASAEPRTILPDGGRDACDEVLMDVALAYACRAKKKKRNDQRSPELLTLVTLGPHALYAILTPAC